VSFIFKNDEIVENDNFLKILKNQDFVVEISVAPEDSNKRSSEVFSFFISDISFIRYNIRLTLMG
jgi:hypothetical protein